MITEKTWRDMSQRITAQMGVFTKPLQIKWENEILLLYHIYETAPRIPHPQRVSSVELKNFTKIGIK